MGTVYNKNGGGKKKVNYTIKIKNSAWLYQGAAGMAWGELWINGVQVATLNTVEQVNNSTTPKSVTASTSGTIKV